MRRARAFALLRTVAYGVLFLLGWSWAARSVRHLDSVVGLDLPSWLSLVGWFLFIVGVTLLVAFTIVLPIRGLGTPAPFDAPRRLIVTGPYRFVRNPIYVAGVAALIGYGFAVRSVSVLLLAGLSWLLVHSLVVVYEEPHLQRVFGQSYDRYRTEVNRWLPRLPRASTSVRESAGEANPQQEEPKRP